MAEERGGGEVPTLKQLTECGAVCVKEGSVLKSMRLICSHAKFELTVSQRQ